MYIQAASMTHWWPFVYWSLTSPIEGDWQLSGVECVRKWFFLTLWNALRFNDKTIVSTPGGPNCMQTHGRGSQALPESSKVVSAVAHSARARVRVVCVCVCVCVLRCHIPSRGCYI